MEILLLALLILAVVICFAVVFVVLLRGKDNNTSSSTQVAELKLALEEMQKQTLQQQISIENNIKTELNRSRESVDKIREELGTTVNDRLHSTQKNINEHNQVIARLLSETTEKITNLERTNMEVKEATASLSTLQNILLNPKQRGVVGETILSTILGNVLQKKFDWDEQVKLDEGKVVDAVIFIDRKLLPIDAKFSLENYNRFTEEQDQGRRKVLEKAVSNDLKTRIDETEKYILPNKGTMDFAFMFIPSEALYYDLLVNQVGGGDTGRDLIEYAFAKKVVIVSATTLTAYLQTVLQGLRNLQIEKDAQDIKKHVMNLETHIKKYEEYLSKLGSSLGTTVGHFNNATKQFNLIDRDIVKITESEERVSLPDTVDRPQIND